jgi:hypothetical protein
MADQDNKSKMAVPNQPKELAKKLVKNDISGYVVGPESKNGVKKFSGKHPILRTGDANNNDAESDSVFNATNLSKEKTTRRADYDTNEDETSYESNNFKRKIIERFLAKSKGDLSSDNAQKIHAISTGVDGHEKGFEVSKHRHEKKEVKGVNNAEACKEIKTKLPPQVVASEEVLTELGEPMSPAPATSDNPGWSGDSATATGDAAPDNNSVKNSNPSDDSDDESEDKQEVDQVREYLENIAMIAAELFEHIDDDDEFEKWIVEKLKLAHEFLGSVSKEMKERDDVGEEDEDEEEEGNEPGKDATDTQKPTAFKGGDQSMTKEEVERIMEATNIKDIAGLKKVSSHGDFDLYKGKDDDHLLAHKKTGEVHHGFSGKTKDVQRYLNNYEFENLPRPTKEEVEFYNESVGRKHNKFSDWKNSAQNLASHITTNGKVDFKTKEVGIGDKKWHQTSSVIHNQRGGQSNIYGVFNHDKKGSESGHGYHLTPFELRREETELGKALGSEKNVRLSKPHKDEFGNPIKHYGKYLAKKAMKMAAKTSKKGA